MANKLIHYNNKQNFETDKDSITDHSLVFIQDSEEIYTHSEIYKGISWSILENNPWVNLSNGVYAVSSDGLPVTYENADESCIAVALIVNDAPTPQRLMIEKYEDVQTVARKAAYDEFGATNTSYMYFYWGGYGTDQPKLTNYSEASSTLPYGYVPLINGTYYDSYVNKLGIYTTWTGNCALNDWNGKANSETIKTIITNGTNSDKVYCPMGIYLNKFNSTKSENYGYTDWYIPSCGQLALIHTYTGRYSSYGGDVDEGINAMLVKIGGTKFDTYRSTSYFSSSEYNSQQGWRVDFNTGFIGQYYKNKGTFRVRLVRDL